MRARRLLPLFVLASGCASSPPRPRAPAPEVAPAPEETRCEHPLSFGLDRASDEVRAGLARGVRDGGLVSVRLDPEGCGAAALAPLGACLSAPSYAYAPVSEPGPIVGRYRGPSGLSRAELSGLGCEQATHVVVELEVGAESSADTCPKGQWNPMPGCGRPMRVRLEELHAAPEARPASILTGGIALDRVEVSVADYAKCVEAKACAEPLRFDPAERETHAFCNYGRPDRVTHPVNCVRWRDARDYCGFVGRRLPTEKEWADAAGSATYVWGEAWPPPEGAGNFSDAVAADAHAHWVTLDGVDGFAETGPVDALGADVTLAGVVGLAGNVREWVGPAGRLRVARGASFGEALSDTLRVDRRLEYAPGVASAHIGFRCAADASVGASRDLPTRVVLASGPDMPLWWRSGRDGRG